MFKNLIELTKVRIGFLVLTTTIIGFYLGSQGKIDNILLFFTVIGTLFSSTGSSVMNNVIESESDKLMKRTKDRVLPTEKISLNFAKFLGISFIILGLSIPIIAFYFMYRWEKLKNKSKNLTLITGVGVSIVGILLIIALLID